ncbi:MULTISPECIES: ABC transporter substrate-binding protein [Roseobacteraceae]|uniref:ABC transporter substrate-binding protein n=1 Tax=Roseobacteraceae TaxID=2854170 RepID=UPI001869BF9E|nr:MULTISPECIES: ABC transporter substrate-binding protein [Roseobacteraceae]|tara:strand:+ start:3237 stop:4301 length:1065 start_codon:yes stop_codon:yes gene_type:complete
MMGYVSPLWRMSLMVLCLIANPAMSQEASQRFIAKDATPSTVLLVRSTTDISIFAPALAAFVAANPSVEIAYEQWGSNALYANSLGACEGTATPADVVISSGVHQMVDLVNRACASAYQSEFTAQLPAARRWRDELWGITREAAVIIYNTDLVSAEDAPRTRFALLDLMRRSSADFMGRIATYDVEASGLGFLFAFMDSQEATTFGGLLEGFARVDAVATCCSAEIIEGVDSGRYKIAYNVLGSYVDTVPHENLGVIYPEDYTLFLSRAFMIPKGTHQGAAAGVFLDFLLSPRGRALLSQSTLIHDSNSDETAANESATRYIPIGPTLLVAMDRHRRARFIEKWRDSFGVDAVK